MHSAPAWGFAGLCASAMTLATPYAFPEAMKAYAQFTFWVGAAGLIASLLYLFTSPLRSPWRSSDRKAEPLLPATARGPLRIEFKADERHERVAHSADSGQVRRTIYASVVNSAGVDLDECALVISAATPPLHTGGRETAMPVFLKGGFGLRPQQVKFVPILSFPEVPGASTDELSRNNIIVHAATGGWSAGWTTLPLLTKETPAALTLEASAFGVVPCKALVHVWVDEAPRRLRATFA